MTSTTVVANSGRFRKGRTKTGGRRKGTPNRATQAVKEFLSGILDDPEVQDAVRERILSGDTGAFFKAVEIVHGKPRQAVQMDSGPIRISWKDSITTRLEKARKRLAAAREHPDDPDTESSG